MASFLNFTRDKQVNKVVEVEVNQIIPNPHQPRTEFEDTDIRALAESIAQNGILQPISIRRNGDIYELIAREILQFGHLLRTFSVRIYHFLMKQPQLKS